MRLRGIIAIIVAVILVIVGFSCFTKVPTGHTGVVTTFGKVEDYTFASGLHFKSPVQRVIKMDNRTQKVTINNLMAFSSDIQQVDVEISINYCIDQTVAQNLYRSIGISYYETVIYPRILEDAKAVFTSYTAENLVAHRGELSSLIKDKLSVDVEPYGIQIVAVNVENIDFTDTYTNAVEAKQVAEQERLKAKINQDQLTIEKTAEAARQVIKANADAEVVQINADAEYYEATKLADAQLYAAQQEAEGNIALRASLTADLIKYQQILQWNGVLPQFVGSGSTYPVLTFD